MPLMGAIYVGQSGIQTSQNSLNTTAHNLSNLETKGYTRQQILQGNKFYNQVGNASVSKMQVGLGVDYTKTRQVRDRFLDASYRMESGRAAFYDICAETTGEIQTLLGEMEGASFENSLSDLWTAIQELQKDPSSAVTQGVFVARASQFLERTQAVYKGLFEYQQNLNSRINDKVDEINNYAKQIYALNLKIQKNECGEEEANDIRDERNLIVDKLSKLVNTKIVDNGTDAIEVYVENIPLVLDSFVNEMKTTVGENGFYDVTWGSSFNDMNVFSFDVEISSQFGTDVGELKSLIYARGDHRADYTDLLKKDSSGNYVDDRQSYLNSGDSGKIAIADSIVMNTQAEFDRMIHGIVTSINDIFTDGKMLGFDGAHKSQGETTGFEVFQRLGMERYDSTGNYRPEDLGNLDDADPANPASLYTIINLKINPDLLKQPTLNTFTLPDGSVDTQKADALIAAFSETQLNLNPDTASTFNYVDFYSAIVGQVANTGSVYDSICASQQATTDSLESARQEVLGVASDDELQNMIKFQNAFNASSRYINVINDMLDTIINRLGGG